MRTWTIVRAAVVAAACLALWPADAHADKLRCKSTDYKYNFCSTRQPIERAWVRSQKSKSQCIQGRTWGIERNGIWVNDGCEAEFEVVFGRGGGYYPPGPSYPPGGYPPGPGSRPPYPGPTYAPPAWMIGSWQGSASRRTVTLLVFNDGTATYMDARGYRVGGRWERGDRIVLQNGGVITVSRDRNGIRVNAPNAGRVTMRRVR